MILISFPISRKSAKRPLVLSTRQWANGSWVVKPKVSLARTVDFLLGGRLRTEEAIVNIPDGKSHGGKGKAMCCSRSQRRSCVADEGSFHI